jgi:predicted RNA-binding Zn-ribbon protein involved in translation (DUF1610 family)
MADLLLAVDCARSAPLCLTPLTARAIVRTHTMYGYLQCPACGQLQAERSRTRGLERLLKHFTQMRPYRCAACGWRAWCRTGGGLELRTRGTVMAWFRTRRPVH